MAPITTHLAGSPEGFAALADAVLVLPDAPEGERKYLVHTAVLARRSPFFCDLFSTAAESRQGGAPWAAATGGLPLYEMPSAAATSVTSMELLLESCYSTAISPGIKLDKVRSSKLPRREGAHTNNARTQPLVGQGQVTGTAGPLLWRAATAAALRQSAL